MRQKCEITIMTAYLRLQSDIRGSVFASGKGRDSPKNLPFTGRFSINCFRHRHIIESRARRGTVAGSQQVDSSRQHMARLFTSPRREIRQHRQLVHFLSGGELQPAARFASPHRCTHVRGVRLMHENNTCTCST